MYNLALARHLAWGYVDVAPMIALIGRVEITLFGDSLSAIRLAPALAGAGLVLLTGAIARELGGRPLRPGARRALRAARSRLSWRSITSSTSTPSSRCAGWAARSLLIRIINTGNQKLWLWFGLLAGLGLETKHSMLIFGFASGGRARAHVRSASICSAAGCCSPELLAFLLFLPNLLWNIQHHFPFLELQENIRRSGRNVSLSLGSFFGQEDARHAAAERCPSGLRDCGGCCAGATARSAFAWVIAAALIFAHESARLLSVPRIPHALRGGRRAVRILAGAPAACVDQAACGAP